MENFIFCAVDEPKPDMHYPFDRRLEDINFKALTVFSITKKVFGKMMNKKESSNHDIFTVQANIS